MQLCFVLELMVQLLDRERSSALSLALGVRLRLNMSIFRGSPIGGSPTSLESPPRPDFSPQQVRAHALEFSADCLTHFNVAFVVIFFNFIVGFVRIKPVCET